MLSALAATAAAVAYAQSPSPSASGSTLHEFIPSPTAQTAASSGYARALGSATSNVLRSGDKLIPKPSTTSLAGPGEPPLQDEWSVDRKTQWTPDRTTQQDGTLHYVEVFNPSVLPFKRSVSLDAIHADYTLYTASSGLTDVRVGGKIDEDRDQFWGSAMIELQTGQDIAIPSVSPDMRLLSYETTPKIRLSFSKDAADNYYVRTDEPGIDGSFRVVFRVDANSQYFAPKLPHARVSDIPRSLVNRLPPSMVPRARAAIEVLRLRRNMTVKSAMNILTTYFRSFEAKVLTGNGGDVFWDLFTTQAGVCRHRSFGFYVVATQLGIPTRYIYNEAHAFVEVWLPDVQWVRVDLGGAALELEVSNAESKSMHVPRNPDPFAQPKAFAENYSTLGGGLTELTGLPEGQKRQKRQAKRGSRGPGPSSDPEDGDTSTPAPPGVPSPTSAEAPASTSSDQAATTIAVLGTKGSGLRGDTLTVSGRLSATGASAGGLPVHVFLVANGSEDEFRVGQTRTRADGTFEVMISISGGLPLGDYRVYASTPGDKTRGPALSE